jgi:hypothetical protein
MTKPERKRERKEYASIRRARAIDIGPSTTGRLGFLGALATSL